MCFVIYIKWQKLKSKSIVCSIEKAHTVNKRVKLRTESKTFTNNLADSTYNKYDELWIVKSIDKNSFFIFHSLQFCATNID